MSTSAGTKVTKDPQALNDPKVEKPGTVTSDSLAGESAKSGGDFASNTNPSVLNQPSSSTTSNTTDISGATVLDAAPDAEARQAQESWSETSQLNAGIGLGKTAGRGPTWAPGAPAPGDGSYNTTTGSGANVGAAPSYVNAGGATGGPHGKNLTEGGFDSDGPNASFNNDIGGKNDPGRAALGNFQTRAAEPIEDAGMGDKNKGAVSNSFDALGGETSS
ncbi:hypothetical protein AAFC00_004934 [Neodothiora populina]|uniref:Uncharacterized protein n=1 Tax=Neodothiora populina TaxID=2781224 RepID=A0ABR3P520_9PEZI